MSSSTATLKSEIPGGLVKEGLTFKSSNSYQVPLQVQNLVVQCPDLIEPCRDKMQ